MLKATHKRRVTTLSKTLLTAGLLGGAALSTLGAGSAKAAWTPDPAVTDPSNSYACTFGGAVLCEVGDPTGTVGAPPNPSDKILTLLGWDSIADGSTLVFEYQTPDSHPWHVDVDFAVIDTDGGFLAYTMEITDPSMVFNSAVLAGQLQSSNPSVTKQIFSSLTDLNAGTGAICDITIGPAATQTCDISGKQIWVKDTWANGQGVDNFANDYSQVPAPLPLLGVAATFGSIRKLRKFSSQLKTFSMG